MNFDTTYKNLKKRIFDILDEYCSDSDTVFISSGDREHISSRIPDAVNSSLVRMYVSLPLGRKSTVQRLNRFTPIVGGGVIAGGDSEPLSFISSTANMAIFFRYFGSGTLSFYNSAGKVIGTIDCAGKSSLLTKRVFLSLASSSVYSVKASGNLKISDFCVYVNDGRTNVLALCAADEVSFELPEDCERLIEVKGEYGLLDKEKIRFENGFGFLQRSDVGVADALDIQYIAKPNTITDSTDDGFVFSVSPLAFEALVCLAASEVCRDEDAATHTRLIYKYRDLCEGLLEEGVKKRRNTFFSFTGRKLR